MCVILAQQPNSKKFPKEYYDKSVKSNPDGNGVMWVEDGAVHMFKHMLPEPVWEKYEDVYDRLGHETPIVIHARIGTSGGKRTETCHPFRVNDEMCFCHNGILDIKPTETKSDTMVFNEMVLQPILNDHPEMILRDEFKELLEGVIGHNKLVFLTANQDMVIVGENLGVHEEKGDWWFSNNTYKPYAPTKYTKKTKYSNNSVINKPQKCFCCGGELELHNFVKIVTTCGPFQLCKDCYDYAPYCIDAKSYGMTLAEYTQAMDDEAYLQEEIW